MTCPCFKSFCCSISCEHSDLQFSKKWRTGDSCSIQGDCCLVIFNRTPDLAKRLQWGSMHISSGRCLHRLSFCSFLMCEPGFQKLIHSWHSGLCATQGGKGPLSLESHRWLPLYPAFCCVFVKAPARDWRKMQRRSKRARFPEGLPSGRCFICIKII